jgi:hypothetical protein
MGKDVVYFIRFASGLVKIGHTSQMRHRMAKHRTDSGAFRIIGIVPGGPKVETAMHAVFAQYRVHRTGRGIAAEIFDFPGSVAAAVEAAFASSVDTFLAEHGCDRGFCKLKRSRSPHAIGADAR